MGADGVLVWLRPSLAFIALENRDEDGCEVAGRVRAVAAVTGVVAAALPGVLAPEAEVGRHVAGGGGAPGAEGLSGEAEEAAVFFDGAFAHSCVS